MSYLRLIFFRLIALTLAAFCTFACAKEPLLIYTAVEPEYLSVYKQAFEKQNPDLEIVYIRDSAGPISARLIAEKNHPKADVIFGLSAIALEKLRQIGLLKPYRPQNADLINPKMRAKDFAWFGMNAWGGSICVNTDLLQKRGLPIPQSWEDLLNPIYEGQIVMPSPFSSSTGFMFLLGWIQGMGEEKGWDYVEKLHRNILFYTPSGARPAAMAAQGEIPIALTSEAFVKPFMRFKIPVTSIEPESGIAWDAEGCAMPRGTPHPENAKRFLDFCASKDVGDVAAAFSGISAIDRYSTEAGQKIAERFIALDFRRAADERQKIIERWQKISTR